MYVCTTGMPFVFQGWWARMCPSKSAITGLGLEVTAICKTGASFHFLMKVVFLARAQSVLNFPNLFILEVSHSAFMLLLLITCIIIVVIITIIIIINITFILIFSIVCSTLYYRNLVPPFFKTKFSKILDLPMKTRISLSLIKSFLPNNLQGAKSSVVHCLNYLCRLCFETCRHCDN